MRFLDIPYDIQAEIFTLAACLDGPPAAISTLSRTCRVFHRLIHDVLGEISQRRYDFFRAPRRRLGPLSIEACLEVFIRRCRTLKRIKTGIAYGDMIVHDLWVTYLMLLEDDGSNLEQLEHADVESWARNIIVSRSHENLDPNGWPLETEVIQLAMAILARVITRASISRLTDDECEQFLSKIQPFFIAGHRYPVALLPLTHFVVSHSWPLPPSHTHTFHTMASMPIYPAEELPFPHFGRMLTLCRPPLAQSCILVWFLHEQRKPLGYLPSTPANRTMANATGRLGATVEDYEQVNFVQRQGYGIHVPRATYENGGSRRWDMEWYRLALAHFVLSPDPLLDSKLFSCWYRSVHEPGKFTGNWVGRALVPHFTWYTRMLFLHPATLDYVSSTVQPHERGCTVVPMQFRLQEHFTTEITDRIGTDSLYNGSGVLNGWFPEQLRLNDPRGGMRLTTDELVIEDPSEPDIRYSTKRYKTWSEGIEFPVGISPPGFPLASVQHSSPNSTGDMARPHTPPDVEEIFDEEFDDEYSDDDDENIPIPQRVDIILTGKTDEVHGQAWGHYETYGRLRCNDGFFVLVRAPQNSAHGKWIFSGYMYGDYAIVGRWRETATSHDRAGLEGSFFLTRMPDSWPQVQPPAPY